MQKEFNIRKNKGKIVDTLEDEPIKFDFKINGIEKLTDIPVEGLGVYSFRANVK